MPHLTSYLAIPHGLDVDSLPQAAHLWGGLDIKVHGAEIQQKSETGLCWK
jgi:hypothetical protein